MFGFYIVGLRVKPYLVLLTPFRSILSFFATLPPPPPKRKISKNVLFSGNFRGYTKKKIGMK